MEKYQRAEAFVEVLNANGVECVFFNPGSAIIPIQVAFLKYKAAGKLTPRLVLCLDESVAMAAAHGHYLVSGRPQVVMVHDELGTLQVGGAIHNVQWGRVPVILWGGKTPSYQRLDWEKEPFDICRTLRNCVKWDHMLDRGEDIHAVLQQAFQTAFTEPCGPVHLSYPQEILTEKVDRVTIPSSAPTAISSTAPADNDSLNKAAEMLLEAKNPLILAGYTSRHPESVAMLIELAETLGAPVLSGLTRMNFPTTHPLSAGIEDIGQRGPLPVPLAEERSFSPVACGPAACPRVAGTLAPAHGCTAPSRSPLFVTATPEGYVVFPRIHRSVTLSAPRPP